MTAKVEIVVSATDKASGPLKTVEAAFSGIQNRIMSLVGANMLETLGRKMLDFAKDSVEATVKYANSVRELQMVSGQTAEEASRMIQVFDDFKINIDNITPAIRKMTSEGLTPNLETIAQLADEYNALTSPLEKNKLLMDKFGRAGLDMAEMMSKGGDAIREMAGAVDESLLMTQEAENQARQYELAVDSLNDAMLGLKIQIGSQTIPALTQNAEALAVLGEYGIGAFLKLQTLQSKMNEGKITMDEYRAGIERAGIALGDVPSAADMAVQGIENVTEAAKDFSSDVTFVMNFQTQTGSYEAKKEEILAKMTELKDKILATQAEVKAGTETADALGPLQADMVGLTGDLNKNEAEFKKWQKTAVFSLIQAKLAADGLTGVEFDQLMNIGEEMGVLDPAVVDSAVAMLDEITGVDPSNLSEAAKDLKYIVSQDGQVVTVYVNTVTTESTGTIDSGQAGGGSFDVPYGYPNDSYMMGLSSGEHVEVTTTGQKGAIGGGTVNNHFYYGAKILLERGYENEILARLTE